MAFKVLLVVHSYHHHNTLQIAQAMAQVLDAEIRKPQQLDPQDLDGYSLVGFGSGIASDKHYRPLLNFADRLPTVTGRKTFIFSTCGVPAFGFSDEYVRANHAALREKLQARGYTIVDEFSCVGHNTNSFLKAFGGINKGRPNAQDLQDAMAFARRLGQRCRTCE